MSVRTLRLKPTPPPVLSMATMQCLLHWASGPNSKFCYLSYHLGTMEFDKREDKEYVYADIKALNHPESWNPQEGVRRHFGTGHLSIQQFNTPWVSLLNLWLNTYHTKELKMFKEPYILVSSSLKSLNSSVSLCHGGRAFYLLWFGLCESGERTPLLQHRQQRWGDISTCNTLHRSSLSCFLLHSTASVSWPEICRQALKILQLLQYFLFPSLTSHLWLSHM